MLDMERLGTQLRAATQDLVTRALAPIVARLAALEQRPAPADGKDGAPGKDGVNGRDGRDGAAGRDGKDGERGIDGAPGTAGRDGANGKDGAPGRDGKDGERGIDGRDGADGRDGVDGKDGRDGFSLKAFDVATPDGGRTLVFAFEDGETRFEAHLDTAMMIYRGVFRDGEPYSPGDTVTWGGSLWHCNADTTDKPGEGGDAWTLAAKKGRDGKAGERGPQGERGADGRPGRDLTQMGFDGAKY